MSVMCEHLYARILVDFRETAARGDRRPTQAYLVAKFGVSKWTLETVIRVMRARGEYPADLRDQRGLQQPKGVPVSRPAPRRRLLTPLESRAIQDQPTREPTPRELLKREHFAREWRLGIRARASA